MDDDANSVALSNITLKEIIDVINKYRTRPLNKKLGTQQLNIEKPKEENIFEKNGDKIEEPIDDGMDYEEVDGDRPNLENRRNWPPVRREIRDDETLTSSDEEDDYPYEQRVPPFVNAHNARQKYISSVPDMFRSRLEDIQENFIQVKRDMQDFEHYEKLIRDWLISNVGKENCNLRGVVKRLADINAPIKMISYLSAYKDKGDYGNDSIAPLRALESYNGRLYESYNTIREKWVETQNEVKQEIQASNQREANYIKEKENVTVVEEAAQIKDLVSIFNELKDSNQKTVVKLGTVVEALNNFLIQFPTNKANNPNEDKLTPAISRLTTVLDSLKNNQIKGDLDSVVASLKAIASEAKAHNTLDKKTVDLDVKGFTSALDELISKFTALGNGVTNVDTQLRTFTTQERSLVNQLISNLENKLTPIKNESITKALEALSNSISSSLAVAPQLSNIIKALDNISTKLDSTVNKHQISYDNYISIKDYIDKLMNAHKQILDDLSKKNEAATNNAFTSISQTQNNYSPDMKQLSVVVTKEDLAILIKEAYVAANLQLNNVSEDFINRFYELFMQKKKKEEEEEARYRGPKDPEPNIYNTRPPGPPPPGSTGGLFSSLLGRSSAKADEILNSPQNIDSNTLRKNMNELSDSIKQIPKKIEIDDMGLKDELSNLANKISQIPADIRHQVEIPDLTPQVTVNNAPLFPQDVATDIKSIKNSLQKLSNSTPIPPIQGRETTNEIIGKLDEWLKQNKGLNLIDFETRIDAWWNSCVETTIVSKTTIEKTLIQETIKNWKEVTAASIAQSQEITQLSIENHSKKIETVISEYFSKNSVHSAQLIRKDIGSWFEANKDGLLANVKLTTPTVKIDSDNLREFFAGWWSTVTTNPTQTKAILEVTESKKREVLSEIQNEIKVYIKGIFNDPEIIKRQQALEFELKNEMQNRRIAELQADYVKKHEELNAEYAKSILNKRQELFDQQQAMISQMNEEDRLFYLDKQKKRQELENEIQTLELTKQQQEGQNVTLDASTQSKLAEHKRILDQLNNERSKKGAEIEQFKLNAAAELQNLKQKQEQSALMLRGTYEVELREVEQTRRRNEELRQKLFEQEQYLLKNEEDMKVKFEQQRRKQEKSEHAERFGNMLLSNYSNIPGLEVSVREIQAYIDLLTEEGNPEYEHLIKTSERFKRQIQQRLLYLSAEEYGLQFISDRLDSLSREPVCVIRNEEGVFNILPIPQSEDSPRRSFLFVPSLTEYVNERRSNNNMALSSDPTRSGKSLYDDINDMLIRVAIKETVTMDDITNLMSRNKEGWKAFTYEEVEGQPTDLYVNILKRLREVIKNNHNTSDIADMNDSQQGVILTTLNKIISEKERVQTSNVVESALVDDEVVRRFDPFNSHRALTYIPQRAIEYSPANTDSSLNSGRAGVLTTIAKPPQNVANAATTNAPATAIPNQLAIEMPTNNLNQMEITAGKLINKKEYVDDTVTSKRAKKDEKTSTTRSITNEPYIPPHRREDSTVNLINQPPAGSWTLVPYKTPPKPNMDLVIVETIDSVMYRPISELRQRLRQLFYNLEKNIYLQSELAENPDLDYYNLKMDNFRLVKKIKSIAQNIELRINREIKDQNQRSEIDSEMFKYGESLKKFGRITEMNKVEFTERIRLTKQARASNILPNKIDRAEDEDQKIRKTIEDMSNRLQVVENSKFESFENPKNEKLKAMTNILDELHNYIKSLGGYENLYKTGSEICFDFENRLIRRISSIDYVDLEKAPSSSYVERPGFTGFKKEYGIDFMENDNSSSTFTVDPLTGEPIKINTKTDGKRSISAAPQAKQLFDDVFGDQSVPVVGEPGSSTIPTNNTITDNNRVPNEEAEPIYYKPVTGPTFNQINKVGYPASIIRPPKFTPPNTPSRSTDVEQKIEFEGEDEVSKEFNENDSPDILKIKHSRQRDRGKKSVPYTTRPTSVKDLKESRAKSRAGERTGNGFKKGLVNKMKNSENIRPITLKKMDKIHGAMKNYFAKTTFHEKKPLSKLKIAKKIVDDYYDKYNSSQKKDPKDINCGHCGKGVSLDDESEGKKFHLANTGEIMHRDCFKSKGCTPNRTLYKRGFGYDVEHNSPNEKAKGLAKDIDTFKAHHKLANQKYPTMWEEFYVSAKSKVPNVDKFLSAAKERNVFYGRFNERRLNELVFLLGFANNKLEDTRNNSEREQIIDNIEVGIAKFLQTRDYKKTSSSYLPTSNFSKLKNRILNNPGILHNLDF